MTPSQTPLLDALKWRYATKKFDPARRIPEETWETLEHSLSLTPSSFGLQPWQFLVIRNPEIRTALRAESWGQAQLTDASHLVVFTVKKNLEEEDISRWVARLGEVQSTPLEVLAPLQSIISGFVAPMDTDQRRAWNTRQLYIALGQFMTAAAVLGIDTCPLEGINPAGYDRVLGLEGTEYATVVACAAGYRAEDDRYAAMPKARFAREAVIRHI
ncbi:NAD(P)H-dependent oxidoreductase [Luteolibacter sp. SL250]|uniref:NAD(P)H-dependent oxidoreductase n=1 Tax=Luteolibacter sp. SL250 TaxID=2995170 RepID=UPI00226FFF75|nr:NAD(P)H-dependent oxidoreductase [Luteolibacter sp. SL250]WAC20312.1 NAD(P)H-dependent oxidoreductase [Luteolibacter sp. SL250]